MKEESRAPWKLDTPGKYVYISLLHETVLPANCVVPSGVTSGQIQSGSGKIRDITSLELGIRTIP